MALANECIPIKEPGDRVTGTPSAAVTGKRFVAISGNRQADGTYTIAPPAAAGRVFGVASHDAAAGAKVTVIRGRGTIAPILAADDIAAFEEVEVDNVGRVVPLAAGVAVGFAVTAAADATDAHISLY